MASEPAIKRAVAFVHGQNLFYAAKIAFGYSFPNYDVRALAAAICGAQGWQLDELRFYTGIPDASDNEIDRALYYSCIDVRDYRPKKPVP